MLRKFELGAKADRVWKFRGMSVRFCSERRLFVELGRQPSGSRRKLVAGFLLATSLGALFVWQGPVAEKLPEITATWFASSG